MIRLIMCFYRCFIQHNYVRVQFACDKLQKAVDLGACIFSFRISPSVHQYTMHTNRTALPAKISSGAMCSCSYTCMPHRSMASTWS